MVWKIVVLTKKLIEKDYYFIIIGSWFKVIIILSHLYNISNVTSI